MKRNRSLPLWNIVYLAITLLPLNFVSASPVFAEQDTLWAHLRGLPSAELQVQALYQHTLYHELAFPPPDDWEAWVASVDPTEGESLHGILQAQMYYLLGLWEMHQARWDEAQNHLSNSLAQWTGLADQSGQQVTRMALGDVAVQLEDPRQALIHYQQAWELAPQDTATWLGAQSLEKLGTLLLSQTEYERAQAYLQQSLKAYHTLQKEKKAGRVNGLLGDCNRAQQKWEQAIAHYLLSSSQATGYGDTLAIIRSRLNLGKVHRYLGDLEQALNYGEDSYQLVKMGPNSILIAEVQAYLAQVHLDLNDLALARDLAQSALATTRNSGDMTVQRDAIEVLYKISKAQEEYTQALALHEQLLVVDDSLSSRTLQNELDTQEFQKQVSMDSIRKQESIQLAGEKLRETVRRQRLMAIYLGVGLVLSVLFGGFIFNRIRLTKRQEAMLVHQTGQIKEAVSSLQRKNAQMLSSIAYAKRIQAAVLPHETLIRKRFPESFLFARPKGIVAGDFFWIEQVGDTTLLAVADCTGHGVPGALVSIKCSEALNRAVYEHRLLDPGRILDEARTIVLNEFSQTDEPISDGMDIALCAIRGTELAFAGAYNPLWLFRPGKHAVPTDSEEASFSKITTLEDYTLIEVKPDKQPIGRFITSKPYQTKKLQIQPGDTFYLFSDGYADQFGGEQGKKYQKANFKKLLASMQTVDLTQQPYQLSEALNQWKGSTEQVDDITVVGVKVS
ncbi:MAG TPA: hypothetical protein DCP28_05760 [Cytophagales bacterium]|nr:hypothetical protein [Cytophagales bacterium]